MKIMKSGALTAFAALALMASHEVYAAPKGRSFGIVSKTLALMKKYPKTSSSSLGALGFGALGASLYIMHKVTGKKDGSLVSAKGSQGGGSQKEIEMKQKKDDLMKYMDTLITNNDFQKRLSPLVEPIKNLKKVVEKASLSDEALKNLPQMMSGLEGSVVSATSVANEFRFLIEATDSAESVMSEKALKGALGKLMKPLKTLLRDKLPGALQSVTKALSQSRSLGTLVTPFESFADAVRKGFDNLPTGDSGTGALSCALWALEEAMKGEDSYKALELAVFCLGKITSGRLKDAAQDLKGGIVRWWLSLKKK